MLKRTFIVLIVLTSGLFNNNLKAQSITKDSSMYEYAILTYYRQFGETTANLVFANNKFIDLDKKLKLDTMTGSRLNQYNNGLLLSLDYLDKSGYELVTFVSANQYWVLRKKRK